MEREYDPSVNIVMRLLCAAALLLSALFCALPLPALAGPEPKVEASTPRTYEVMEGVAVQLEGKAKGVGPGVSGYRWEILSGRGGKLYDDKTSKVTFISQKITGEKEPFVLQLTTAYGDGREGKARINILVHRRSSEGKKVAGKTVGERVVYRDHGGPWPGWGFGYVWSRPVYVPVYAPCPGCDLDWDEYDLVDPGPLADTALPEELLEDLPEDLGGIDPVEPGDIEDLPGIGIEPIDPGGVGDLPDIGIEPEPLDELPDMPMGEPLDMPMDEPFDEPMDIPDIPMDID